MNLRPVQFLRAIITPRAENLRLRVRIAQLEESLVIRDLLLEAAHDDYRILSGQCGKAEAKPK